MEHDVISQEYFASMSMGTSPEGSEFSMMLDGSDEMMSFALDIAEEDMSLSLDGSGDFDESMSMRWDPSTTGIPTPQPPPEVHGIPDYIKITIEYLARCANATLDLDSCLVSNTIIAFESMTDDDDDDASFDPTVRRRFLEAMTMNDDDDDSAGCVPPSVNDEEMRAIITGSKHQCEASGIPVLSTELESTINELKKFFKADQCWISLCEDFSTVFLNILFREVASCAGADLNFHPCILDHVVETYAFMSDPDYVGDGSNMVRRPLRRMVSTVASDEKSESMDSTSDCGELPVEEIAPIVKKLLSEADATCLAAGVAIEEKDLFAAFDDMLKVFGNQKCWGPVDCEEEPTQPTSRDKPTEVLIGDVNDGPTDEPANGGDDVSDFFFMPDVSSKTERRCSGVGSDDGTERTVEVLYFYRLETASELSEQEGATVLDAVEQTLLTSVADNACVYGVFLENIRRLEDSLVVAVDSAPKDVVSSNCEFSFPSCCFSV